MPYVQPHVPAAQSSSPSRAPPPPHGSWGPAASPSWSSESPNWSSYGSTSSMAGASYRQDEVPSSRRQLRNHIRSQSHDQVATLTSLSTLGSLSDESLASTYASIQVFPASPGDGRLPLASGSGAQDQRAEASPEASDDQSEGLHFSTGRRQRAHKRTKGNADTSPHTRATPLPPTHEREGGSSRQPDWLVPRSGSAAMSVGGSNSISAPAPSPADERGQSARTVKLDLAGGLSELPIGSRAATPMIRKKSGELVRSSLKPTRSEFGQTIGLGNAREVRAKSVPSTPTGPKYVHFDSQLEHGQSDTLTALTPAVKLFLAQQRPTAVSRQGSPGAETETETEGEGAFPFPPMLTALPPQMVLHAPDVPTAAPTAAHRDDGRDVLLESLTVAADNKSLRGTVVVRNISYEKRIAIRFTTDDWQTVSEVAAEFSETCVGAPGFDRWSFAIKLQDLMARIESITILLAVRYSVDGRELWDNNNERNYRLGFRREQVAPANGGPRSAGHTAPGTARGSTPLANSFASDLRRELDRLAADDFGGRLPLRSESTEPAQRSLASRYDIGASLKNRGIGHRGPSALLANPWFHPGSGAHSPSGSYNALPLVPAVSSSNPAPHPAHGVMAAQAGPTPTTCVTRGCLPDSRSGSPLYSGMPSASWGMFDGSQQSDKSSQFAARLALNDASLNGSHRDTESGPHSPYHRDQDDSYFTRPRLGIDIKADYDRLRGLISPPPAQAPDLTPPPSSPVKVREVKPSRGSPPPEPAGGVLVSPSPASSSQSSPRSESATISPNSPTTSYSDLASAEQSAAFLAQGYFSDLPSYSRFLSSYCYATGDDQPGGSALGLADLPRMPSSILPADPGATTPTAAAPPSFTSDPPQSVHSDRLVV